MTIDRGFVPNHKTYDKIGRVTPNVEYSASERPHSEFMAAPWLPVASGRWDESAQTYIIISQGKPVAVDGKGQIVPAGLRKKFNKSTSTTVLAYTASDVGLVINLATGAVVTGAASYTEDQLTTALKEQGLIKVNERAMDFISKPIGLCALVTYKAAGTDTYNPTTLFEHNFRPQAGISIVCDYVVAMPKVPAVATTEAMANDNTGGAANVLTEALVTTRTKGWMNATQINAVDKYSSLVATTANLVAYLFTNKNIAKVTASSLISASVAGLVAQKNAVTDVLVAGDYFIDYDMGLLFVYEAGGDAIPSPWTTSATITYYHYDAELSNAGNTYACATGNLKPGDFVTFDENSNFVKASLDIGTAEGYDTSFALYSADPDYSAAADAAISLQIEKAVSGYMTGIVGQVLSEIKYPKDYLDRVKTASLGSAANMKVAGSATGGRTEALTYAGGSDTMLVINLLFR